MTAPLLELYCAAHSNHDEGAAEHPRRMALRASDPPPADDTPFHPKLGAQLRTGDEAAFTAVIAATVPALIRYASVRFRIGVDAAEDVVQEMFARLWVNRTNIPDQVTRGYLFRTVHNAVLNVVEHDRMAAAHAARSADTTAVATDAGDITDTALTLGRLLALLPDRRRQAIELRYWGHLSYAEVAEALTTTPANAERLVARGLVQLQELAAELV